MERDTKVMRLGRVERPIALLLLVVLVSLTVLPLTRGLRLQLPGLMPATTAGTGLPATDLILSEVDVIAVDHEAGCAVTGGTAHCWGSEIFGQTGTNGDAQQPALIGGLEGEVVDVSVGSGFACARLRTAGDAFELACWGANWGGTLGDGFMEASAAPLTVAGLEGNISHVSAGLAHVCATVDGAARCWGSNGYGELGTGAAGRPATVPGTVALGVDLPVRKAVAGYRHTCALLLGGGVRCWGDGGSGQLGNGHSRVENATPSDVPALAGAVVDVTAGGEHTCALLQDGRVQCWGANWWGQLGDGTTEMRTMPTFARIEDVVAISAGGGHTCAVQRSGAAYCWGDNAGGQLGDGSVTDQTTPQPVLGLESGVVTVSAGARQTCALLHNDEARCWGIGMP